MDTNYEEMLANGTRRAQTLLDKLQLTEAQSVYHEVLRQARETPPATESTCCQSRAAERATVTAVGGLAESFARQSRNQPSICDNDQSGSVPWLRLNIQVRLICYLTECRAS